MLNNFDLSPWIEIDSDSDNDISKSDERPTTQKPKRRTTSQRPSTTTKKTANKSSVKLTQKKPEHNTTVPKDMTKQNMTDKLNTTKLTDDNDDDEFNINLTNDITTINPDDMTIANLTTSRPDVTRRNVQIDDKLDFKNKSRRVDENIDNFNLDSRQRPHKYDEYDEYDDDDTQQVQSVVINNVAHKRPYNQRPVITVTENIDKYTYLINYVPRPTESWRQTTRRQTLSPIRDRDVVKVTYQTYDDTYRRPNKPYYYNNRHENQNYRYNRPSYTTKYNYHSSARSNDESVTQKDKVTDKPEIKPESTTDLYKLVTFGYVGTYKGSASTTEKHVVVTDKVTNDRPKADDVGKDILTSDSSDKNMKLSTFYLYETATKPYLQRPTRRNDETPVQTNKYYYIRNVLHKYTSADKNAPKLDTIKEEEKKDILKENYNNPGSLDVNIEERSSVDKLASLDDIETKPKIQNRHRNKVKAKPSSSAKTPSVAFEVIPSEIR